MNEPSLEDVDGWFARRGFGFVITEDGSEYWASLYSKKSHEIFAPRYGRGPTREAAAVSARDRYITEEEPDQPSC